MVAAGGGGAIVVVERFDDCRVRRERRAPLIPKDVAALVASGIDVLVQPSERLHPERTSVCAVHAQRCLGACSKTLSTERRVLSSRMT